MHGRIQESHSFEIIQYTQKQWIWPTTIVASLECSSLLMETWSANDQFTFIIILRSYDDLMWRNLDIEKKTRQWRIHHLQMIFLDLPSTTSIYQGLSSLPRLITARQPMVTPARSSTRPPPVSGSAWTSWCLPQTCLSRNGSAEISYSSALSHMQPMVLEYLPTFALEITQFCM